jgi:hypothetical protein
LVAQTPVAFVEIVAVPSDTFCINVNQAIAHKDVQLMTTLKDIFMNTPTLFKCNYTGPTKVAEFGCTDSCYIC